MVRTASTTTLSVVAVSLPLVFTPVSAASASTISASQAIHANDTILNGKPQPRRVVQQPGQAYFWTKAWQDGEHEADHDLATGNFRDFNDAESAIDWIFDSEE